jgi:hypothetical protein
MSPVCQLQMTLPRGFPEGVPGDGLAEERRQLKRLRGSVPRTHSFRLTSEPLSKRSQWSRGNGRFPIPLPSMQDVGYGLCAGRVIEEQVRDITARGHGVTSYPSRKAYSAQRLKNVYLLMVVNYQNFGDPFVVILALPATFCGIVTMLFITGTTLNVPSLMGAIMAVGVASANSILLVTFARERQLKGRSAFRAALDAGRTRIRPVLMTAAAMVVGMIPMAIGGPGEEQNAALARAVIGGLLFATPTTLLIVPYLFAMLRKRNDGVTAYGVFEDLPDE